ncbi:hypothetical protein HAX54_024788 [Datura stramonium]|uniref:Protein kinase domain-containing protein n=1 Tax=Datura stramonium TaxID=4076 RepID=A0ABS8V040_DATST|nr:hypothetical protein [Datura stramonium]
MGTRGIVAYRPAIGKSFTDPRSGTKYILEKVIGTCGYDYIYKASYYKTDYSVNGNLLPSGYVTVKYLQPGPEAVRSRAQGRAPNQNTINVDTWFVRRFREGLCVSLPYMSEGSIRYILSSRFHYGLPEDCIAIVLKEALLGLNDIHTAGRVHKSFNVGNIFVNFRPSPVSSVEIKLAFAATAYESDLDTPIEKVVLDDGQFPGEPSVPPLMMISEWASAPEVFYTKYYTSDSSSSDDDGHDRRASRDESYYTIKSDIWLVGIAALELAYGNIRVCNRRELNALIKKIRRWKRLPNKLEYLQEEIQAEDAGGKMKKVVGYFKDKLKLGRKKRGERVFAKDFEKLVLDCLSSKASKRPTVESLLQRPYFQNARDLKWFERHVLHGKNAVPTGD